MAILVPLITTPIIANHFGLATTGIWVITTQLINQLLLLDVGLSNSLIRLLAQNHVVKNKKETARILATVFWALALLGILLVIFSSIISNALVKIIELSPNNEDDVRILFQTAVVFVGLSLPLRCGHGMLSSRHRFDVIQLVETIAMLIRLSLIVYIFSTVDPSLHHLGFIVFGSTIAGLFIIFFKGLYDFGGRNILRLENISKKVMLTVISMSTATFIITVASVIHTQFSSSLIGVFIDTEAAAILSLPLLIYLAIIPFFNTFATLIAPVAAGATSLAEKGKLFNSYISTTGYLAAASMALFLFFYAFGDLLLTLWLEGEQISRIDTTRMAEILVVILFGFALSVMGPLARSILSSTGNHWKSAKVEFSTSIFGITLGLFLALYTNLSVLGMALGITITLVIRGIILYPVLISAYFNSSSLLLLKKCYLRPALISIIALLLGEGIHRYYFTDKITLLFIDRVYVWVLPSITWLVLIWIFVISIKGFPATGDQNK